MRVEDGVIEVICEGGYGSEARVMVELRTKFPGIGGTIVTNEGVATALREEHNPTPKSGHKTFLKHVIIKKLEDYFYRTRVYMFSHIPRPLGSVSRVDDDPYEACLYEWAFGTEGFSWEYVDQEGNSELVRLQDWDSFKASFNNAGIDMGLDCADPDDGRISQNIIHQYPAYIEDGRQMNPLWKRIDFGSRSINIDFDKLTAFLQDNREELTNALRNERYEMLLLVVDYLEKGIKKMKELDIGRLDALVGDYRRSNLRHYTARGLGLAESVPVYMNKRTESLI